MNLWALFIDIIILLWVIGFLLVLGTMLTACVALPLWGVLSLVSWIFDPFLKSRD